MVLQYKGVEVIGNLLTLPVALRTRGTLFLVAGCSSCNGLDGIRGRPQVVFWNVGDTSRLAGCVRLLPVRAAAHHPR